MSDHDQSAPAALHRHVFLGERRANAERRTWAVIALCAATMVAEIVGGWLFGSIALVADGLHMSTHVGALTLAALAYVFARRYADDPRFTFGAGKIGDLAGFSSAVALALVALLMAYESFARLFAPAPIRFAEAIAIAALGLAVNLVSAWLLTGAESHGHAHDHGHSGAARDNNLRAAALHVIADATVSALVIVGLTLAGLFGWLWIDPIVGLIGAGVIASWSYSLARDTGAILLDMNPDRELADRLRRAIENDGDVAADLHLWRLGPGHLGAIVSVTTQTSRDESFYRAKLERFRALSHLTIEVRRADAPFPLQARAGRGKS